MIKLSKKIVLIFLLSILFISFINLTQVSAEKPIVVVVKEKVLSFDSDPVIRNNFTLVPMRKIFETFNLNVEWIKETQQIIASDEKNVIKLTVDSKVAQRNGNTINLAVAPQIINNSTYVPIRFIAESLDADVRWDNPSRTVLIDSPNYILPFDYDSFIKDDIHANSYQPRIDIPGYIPYNTSDYTLLYKLLQSGDVIIVDGQYYATEEYADSLKNPDIIYYQDISDGVELTNRTSIPDKFIESEWISERELRKIGIGLTNGVVVDGHYDRTVWALKEISSLTGIVGETLYVIPEIDDEFVYGDGDNQIKTFSGIRMKNFKGVIYFIKSDLIAKGIIKN